MKSSDLRAICEDPVIWDTGSRTLLDGMTRSALHSVWRKEQKCFSREEFCVSHFQSVLTGLVILHNDGFLSILSLFLQTASCRYSAPVYASVEFTQPRAVPGKEPSLGSCDPSSPGWLP
jgi:hypothetical protein